MRRVKFKLHIFNINSGAFFFEAMSESLRTVVFVMSRPRVDELDIFNNINFNQDAEEVLLFGRELMKRNRHTYGTSFFSLFLLFFSVCLILRSTPRSVRHMGKCG